MGKRRRTSGGEGGDTSERISCAQSGAWTQQHVNVGAVEEETWAFDLAHQTTRMRPAQRFGRRPGHKHYPFKIEVDCSYGSLTAHRLLASLYLYLLIKMIVRHAVLQKTPIVTGN